MDRFVYSELLAWKNSSRRKPLMLRGARQVGKTWLMNEFAKSEYDDYVYINFDKNEEAAAIFHQTKDPQLILKRLELIHGKKIIHGKTLIIFDEIQDCSNALGSLKYFNEEANEYHIITAGSLLGAHIAKPASYPVGKVNLVDVYPMTFAEYLSAADGGMYEYYTSIRSGADYVSAFHGKMLEHYRRYLIIGGMPECVHSWITDADAAAIPVIHNEIVKLYENSFTKHGGDINSGRILQVFRSIVPQLAKSNNEKFMYAAIAKSARAKDFEDAIEWLVTSGIIYRIHNVSKPIYPIKAYEIQNYFKLFLLDVGLAKHIAKVTNNSIMLSDVFPFKGQLTENYILEQLVPLFGDTPNFYAFAQDRELDFIIQQDESIIPIEVKSGGSKHAVSFKSYIAKNDPKTAVRFSTNEYLVNGAITNIPLYFAGKLFELIE